MDSKRLSRVEVKDAAKGQVSAVFSTFNVIDHDGDVTLPGAIKDGTEVVISAYGHGSHGGKLPVGKGTIRTSDTEAILDGQFFMDTTHGRDTFLTVKGLGPSQEWSYSLNDVKSHRGQLDGQDANFLESIFVKEVSPVLLGAGINTRTLQVKSGDGEKRAASIWKSAIRPHTAASTSRAWDAEAVKSAIADDATVSDLRSVFAWADPDGDPESAASYKFAHHHGVDGPANIRGLIAGIAALNGSRGDSIPESDRKAVYDHLAGHLRDADRDPPELRTGDDRGIKHLHEEAFEVLEGISDYLSSAKRVAALRAQQRKSLSQVNVEALDWVGDELQRLVTEHKALMRRLSDSPREVAAEELVRLIAVQRGARQP